MNRFQFIIRIDNKGIFIGLCCLVVLLLLFPLVFRFCSGLDEFSKDDFENELMGQAYFSSANKDYDTEIKLYFLVMGKLPEIKSELYLKIGKSFFNKGNNYEALRHYENSLKTGYADSAEVFFNIAMVAQKIDKYDIAIEYYKKSIKDYRYYYDANFNLGNIYFMEKKNNRLALEAYKKALKEFSVRSCYRDMLRREMKIYNDRKYSEINKTIKQQLNIEKNEDFYDKFDFVELLSSGPDKIQAVIHNYIGVIYAMENQDSLALSNFEKAMKINPQFNDARLNFQRTLKKLIPAQNNI